MNRSRTVVCVLVCVAGGLAVAPPVPVAADGAGATSAAVAPVQDRISAGESHTCTIVDLGEVVCWGLGSLGRLGYGNTTTIGDTEKPSQNAVAGGYVPLPAGRTAVSVSAGFNHTCALLNTGQLSCWGSGTSGGLGYGNTNDIGDTETPETNPVNGGFVALPGNLTAKAITAGTNFTCAILSDSSVTCWGEAGTGQLGYGNTNDIGDTETPAQNPVNGGRVPLPGGLGAKKIDAGATSVCAILTNDLVACWGDGANGRLGYGNVVDIGDTETPAQNAINGGFVPVTNGTDFTSVAISVGDAHACAISTGGKLRCWGLGTFGRIGYGNAVSIGDTEYPANNPVNGGDVPLPGNLNPIAVATGNAHTCVVLRLGMVSCFGFGGSGRLGYGNVTNIGDTETPDQNPVNSGHVALPGNERAVAIATGYDTSCAVLEGGDITCWGDAGFGALGYASAINHVGDTETPATNPVDGGRVSLPAGQDVTQLYLPLAPARLMDTRLDGTTIDGLQQRVGIIPGGQEITLFVGGRAGVPLDASAYSLNLTITEPVAAGFLTAYPCGVARPNASNLNYVAGQTIANGVSVKAGLAGNVCLFSSQTTHIVVDVGGFYPKASKFTFLTPARILDTRPDGLTIDGQLQRGGANQGGARIQVPIENRGGVPAGLPKVMIVNVVATEAVADGFITVYPCSSLRPTASNVNFKQGETVANSVTVLAFVGTGICLYSNVTVHMVVDVQGFLDANVDTFLQSGSPRRALDTRPGEPTYDGISQGAGIVGQGQTVEVDVTTRMSFSPVSPAVVVNVTVTLPQVAGFVTVYPCGEARPTASNLNYAAGQTIANAVTVKIGANGRICLYTHSPAHLIADVDALYL